ncbi:TolC family protein [Opitutus sp. ER46]|uniref:TolC family protein n=1 Tax=Opitutus sp. ER46 TaxID=2161864 RepID=UPI001304D8AF|nr:TolC family protein [Opitutus sp. ER46]
MRLLPSLTAFALTACFGAALPLPVSAAPAPVSAPAPGSSRAEFLRVVTSAPALVAAARRTSAAEARVAAAGRLPDPTLEGMGSRMVGPMDERSTMYEVNLRQPLPKAGERAADRDRARATAAMAGADYALMAGEMAADTAMALAEADGAQERIRLLETQLNRLDAVLRSVEVRLASGGGRLADRLTIQSRLAAMQLMVAEERTMAEDALAAARGRLGLAASAPLPAFAAPDAAEIRPDDAAVLQLAAARVSEANAMMRMARASGRPMTSVGVRYEQNRTAMGDENTVGLAFMTDLPWRSRRYARAEQRAASAERDAARTDGDAARFRITTALSRVQRAAELADTARRLSRETVQRLNAEYDAMLRAAGVGANAGAAMGGDSTVFQLVELLEKITDTELQVVRAETALRTAQAELWRYLPTAQFQPQT